MMLKQQTSMHHKVASTVHRYTIHMRVGFFMPNKIDFTFSDTIAGYVVSYDRASDTYIVKTSDDRQYTIKLKGTTYAMLARNLGDPYADATGALRDMLTPG